MLQLNHYAIVPVGPPEWFKEAPQGRNRFKDGAAVASEFGSSTAPASESAVDAAATAVQAI